MILEGENGFWKERRAKDRDDGADWMIVKDKDGNRIFYPERNKDIVADYYETLYAEGNSPFHPFHDHVNEEIATMSEDRTVNEELDCLPTKEEIKQAIMKKKNGKATSDWRNEMIKRGAEPMVDIIYPVIKTFWNEEQPPKQWNEGIITNIWKGKGDKERMENQRGITVSSAIGTIVEEIMTDRLMRTISFTQAQAGGRKGASTADHIFILKSLIAVAMKKGTELIITFYDIKNVYDRADMNDMLYVLNRQGFQGKIWRLTKSLNEGLTAQVKTKAGMTREIKRVKGGKQGGKTMVPLFAKMMDTLPEDLEMDHEMGVTIEDLSISCLEYMDDVNTFAIGYRQQELTLAALNEFALKHQLEWGTEKCKVMEIGKSKERRSEWKFGEKTITNCQTYKYLGEEISRDGKSIRNILERFKKVKGTVRAIMTCSKSKIMKSIETKILLKLHESVTLPTLLYSAETWELNKGDKKEINKIEIWSLKQMLGLPTTTPTPAVIFATGMLYATIRVEMKQLLYLHQLLQKENEHWAQVALNLMDRNNARWAKNNWDNPPGMGPRREMGTHSQKDKTRMEERS